MSQIPKAAIYTKKGDQGTTSLVDGQIVGKHSPRVEAYGDVDELNSVLALSLDSLKTHFAQDLKLHQTLVGIQNHLFNVGSWLATAEAGVKKQLPEVSQNHIQWLEQQIDLYHHPLPKLNEFILPGGHPSSSWLHLARTVCRRAERRVAALIHDNPEDALCLIYLNRLSDFLFTLARWVHFQSQTPELKWNQNHAP